MLDIMAGMDQKDSFYARFFGGFAMSCGGESFSSGCACGSAWDSVMPMKGKYAINYIQYP